MIDDVRFVELRRAFEQHSPIPAERYEGAREAAVALLLRAHDELELLLIKRAEQESDPWSGHVALPGGRRNRHDSDLLHTALRETEEEVGIAVGRDLQLIGALDEVSPRNPRLPPLIIAPFVFAVPNDTTPVIDTREVEAAIWVPLSALRDESAASEILITLETGQHAYPSLRYGDYVIWGLTHRILTSFLEITDAIG
ncbi:MAG TPA: CoA pyrophosphatase [Longimicrobiales bacterium]